MVHKALLNSRKGHVRHGLAHDEKGLNHVSHEQLLLRARLLERQPRPRLLVRGGRSDVRGGCPVAALANAIGSSRLPVVLVRAS